MKKGQTFIAIRNGSVGHFYDHGTLIELLGTEILDGETVYNFVEKDGTLVQGLLINEFKEAN